MNDGTRKMPQNFEEWKQFGEMFAKFLEEEGIPFKRIGEDMKGLNQRVEAVVKWADVEIVEK